jgi:formylglycine-generating enzyme required for sulfatase activity
MAHEGPYAAFISYSSKDAAFARRVHRSLERYRIPKSLGVFDPSGAGSINRIYPVFRDREELPAGKLSAAIEAALQASGALVVVCSPNSAASPWVQREIEYFKGLGRAERIFAIIADDASFAVDGREHHNFPPALRALEPLAADARRDRDGFRSAWLKIVAGLIGVSVGALQNRDQARRRLAYARNIALSVLMAVIFGSAWMNYGAVSDAALSWSKYRRFVDASSALAQAEPGLVFQDCVDRSQDCPLMVVIPEGEFLMGPSDADATLPLHRVSVPRFAASVHEITFADWDACLAGGGCGGYAPYREGLEGGDRPVINVSWSDAQSYVLWLSRMTGQEYRLLSEAEWEYAQRAVTVADEAHHTRYSWGDDPPVCDLGAQNGAVFYGCFENGAQPVGLFPPNAFGVYDMHGNVSEWVEDCGGPFDASRASAAPVITEPCTTRVLRGGSWINLSYEIPTPYRNESIPSDRGFNQGFRVARTISH